MECFNLEETFPTAAVTENLVLFRSIHILFTEDTKEVLMCFPPTEHCRGLYLAEPWRERDRR